MTQAPLQRRISGLIAAAHTPFHPDGSLRLEAIAAQAERYRRFGVSAAFICGTTGEGKLMSVQERQCVAEAWMNEARNHTPVIVHVGCESLTDSQELARHAEAIGVNAIAALAPSFYRPASIDALAHWCAELTAAAPHTPFYYYHIPIMNGVDFRMSEFAPLATRKIPTFAGMKFTDSNLMEYAQCLRWANGRYDVFFGCDEILLAALALGARGAVGSTYNYAAPLFTELWSAYNQGDLPRAKALQFRLQDMVNALRDVGEIAAGKAIMGRLGVECGSVRPPLQNLTPEQTKQLLNRLESLELIDAFLRSASQPFSGEPLESEMMS